MTCPPFVQLFAGEAADHVTGCERCQQVARALTDVRNQPSPSAEFRRGVMTRLESPRRFTWGWLAPIVAVVGLALFVLRADEFTARGGNAQPVVVEIVRQHPGFAVRVKNALAHDVYVGAYLRDAKGDQHWLAPHYPEGRERPSLVRIPAHTDLQLLDTGVVPDSPAKGRGELVGFATDSPARVEDTMRPFYETRTPIEVP